jgi:hypothetical protein
VMFRHFIKDESGMTLALSVMMVVLVGVMGAGLLTFVRSDLETVVEVNRGQRAMDIADAGVQAAKAHLRVDSFRGHYDTNRTNDCSEGIRVGGDNWSKATEIWTDPNGYCVGESTRTDDALTPWREDQGVTKLFAGGRFHVTIECYAQGDTTNCNGGATGDAPEIGVSPAEKKFFKITSTGYDNAAGNGAVRKVEAIYSTAKKTYAPIAYWTPKNIDFNGSTTVRRISFFAGGNITNLKNVTPKTDVPAIYGDWYAPPHNATRRVNSSGTPIETPGFAAVGRVCGATQCTSDSDSAADGYRDYDQTTGAKGQNKRFVAKATDPSSQITFPFDPGEALSDASKLVDPGLVEEMKAAAADQGNYYSTTGTHTISTWPAQGAIYFVDGANVEFKVNSKNKPLPKGVLVVRNGNFEFSNAFKENGFEGVIIVIGNGSTTGKYTQTGGVPLNGYVAASGDMKLAGSVEPSTTIDYTNLNSFYDVKLWSWRELYQ